jgi:GAF domain-containing protein
MHHDSKQETMNEPRQQSAPVDPVASYQRLSEVAQFDLMAPDLAEQLDAIARRTMTRLQQPASYVSIVLDSTQLVIGSSAVEGWVSQVGSTPVEWSFCSHTVAHARPYLVSDAANDPVHAGSPLVRVDGTGSYAGVPLTTTSGQVLGAHCVISPVPQQFCAEDVAELESAAQEIMALLEQHRLQIDDVAWERAWNHSSWDPADEH